MTNDLQPKTIIVIVGPTAVGKTAIAIEVAANLGTSIISADSRQCYKGMSIGTAQPGKEERSRVQHYFIDAFPVTTALSAADYERLALEYLQDIFREKDIAVVCGGTGLYIKALCEGLDEMPEIDRKIYAEVNILYQQKGMDWLRESIHREDHLFDTKGEIQNPARMIRALIFKRSTGKSILEFQTSQKKQRPFRIIKAGLELPRNELYQRINQRAELMMQQGLPEEAKNLYHLRHLKNLQTVGYSEIFDHISGKHDLHTALTLIQQHTRNYAKRQMTWFRKDKDIHWFNAVDRSVADSILKLAL